MDCKAIGASTKCGVGERHGVYYTTPGEGMTSQGKVRSVVEHWSPNLKVISLIPQPVTNKLGFMERVEIYASYI